jgi:hypothetical protein
MGQQKQSVQDQTHGLNIPFNNFFFLQGQTKKAHLLRRWFRKPAGHHVLDPHPFTSSNIVIKQTKVNKNGCFIHYIQEDEYIAQDIIYFMAIGSASLNGTRQPENQANSDILGDTRRHFLAAFFTQ